MSAWFLLLLALLTGLAAAGFYVLWRRRQDTEAGTEGMRKYTFTHVKLRKPEH